MSTPLKNRSDIPELGLGSGPTRVRPPRHPLGLPAGSVRALLTLLIVGLVWTLMLVPRDEAAGIPLYLYYLLFLALGHFFAAHGHSIAGPQTGPASPLYLPGGTLRALIVLGFAAVLGWRYYSQRGFEGLKPTDLDQAPYLFAVLVAAFLFGVILSRIGNRWLAGPAGPPYWFQDILAWLALLAGIGLSAEVIIHLVINPTLATPLQLPQWQAVLTALVGLYFGARS
jgi:hypothetical protein